MVDVPPAGSGSFYTGAFAADVGPVTGAACRAACLASATCVAMTFTNRTFHPCVLYTAIGRNKGAVPATVGAVKCAAGSTDPSTCAHFSPPPPPPPTPPPPPPTAPTPVRVSRVSVDWAADPVASNVSAVPTYLDQVNPGTMARSAPVHDAVFARIRDLGADQVRYLHWDPFALSFPLPGPPVGNRTTWDFRGIDPYVEDFMNASAGHDAVVNFAPMYKWGTNASGFVDPTGVAAGEYFSRIVSWYTKGGFTDELGHWHASNHSYTWRYWEVLNEVDAGSSGTRCASLNNTPAALECAKRYTAIYDGIVTVLKRDHPQLMFTGLVLAFPDCADAMVWVDVFLNPANHRSPVRENMSAYVHAVSYHWYSENGYGQPASAWPAAWWTDPESVVDVFLQSAQFVAAAARIQAAVAASAEPQTRTVCNEVGILAPIPSGFDLFGSDRWWWNLEAAQFAYVYASLARLGVSSVAASQLTGYPSNAPSISMLDWRTGEGTAWFWVVKMLIDVLGSGPKAMAVTATDGRPSNLSVRAVEPAACVHTPRPASVVAAHVDPLFAQGFRLGGGGERVVMLVNTRNYTRDVLVAGAAGATVHAVDAVSGRGDVPYSTAAVPANGSVALGGWGVALVRVTAA